MRTLGFGQMLWRTYRSGWMVFIVELTNIASGQSTFNSHFCEVFCIDLSLLRDDFTLYYTHGHFVIHNISTNPQATIMDVWRKSTKQEGLLILVKSQKLSLFELDAHVEYPVKGEDAGLELDGYESRFSSHSVCPQSNSVKLLLILCRPCLWHQKENWEKMFRSANTLRVLRASHSSVSPHI